MTQYAIITDLNRCTGCLACAVACKAANNVRIGNYWNQVLRIGPTPMYEGAQNPDVELYYLPVTCQHCENPECVNVCPTSASYKDEDGTIQIDPELCIGCQSCVGACPYGVRYLNDDEGVVEKCTLCKDKIDNGELPQCVAQCGGRARFFGDIEAGIENAEAAADWLHLDGGTSYDDVHNGRVKLGEYVAEFSDDEVYHLSDVGNGPSFAYILRGKTWQGLE